MQEEIDWIESLKHKIVEENDKILFNESAGCYLAKHYRAAYIMSWIAIIESLKQKIKQFSNIGDKRATDFIKEIEETESKKNSTDKLIFEKAKECGILDNADSSTINYLWEQRCLFAHPYNKTPEASEVKHIIEQSIKLVLGKPLQYNKDFLINLAENIASKPFFHPNDDERIKELAYQTICRTPPNLHPFFFKTLLSKIGEKIHIPESKSEVNKLRLYIITLFKETPLDIDDEKWSLEDRVSKFPYECYFGFVHQCVWQKLPNRIKEMLIEYIITADEEKIFQLKLFIQELIENNKLEDKYKLQYHSKLDKLSFNSAIDFYGNNNSKFDRIITELKSWQFSQQNVVIDYLNSEKAASIFFPLLDEDKLFVLGKILKECADSNHWKSKSFLENIINKTIKVPDYLKAGIAISAFVNRSNEFELNQSYIIQSIKLLNDVDEHIQEKIYFQVLNTLEKHNPDEWDKMRFNETSLAELSKNVNRSIENWNESKQQKFNNLIDKIKKKYYA